MSQLWQRKAELRALDVQVMIVTFDRDVLAQAYVAQSGIDWPLLADSERRLYRAYGFQRGGWRAIYGLPSIYHYVRLLLSGRPPGRPGKDWRQLGGDVLVDPQGVVRVHHRSTSPHDRPDLDEVLSRIRPQPVVD